MIAAAAGELGHLQRNATWKGPILIGKLDGCQGQIMENQRKIWQHPLQMEVSSWGNRRTKWTNGAWSSKPCLNDSGGYCGETLGNVHLLITKPSSLTQYKWALFEGGSWTSWRLTFFGAACHVWAVGLSKQEQVPSHNHKPPLHVMWQLTNPVHSMEVSRDDVHHFTQAGIYPQTMMGLDRAPFGLVFNVDIQPYSFKYLFDLLGTQFWCRLMLVGWLVGWWWLMIIHLHGVSMCSRCFSNYPSWWSFHHQPTVRQFNICTPWLMILLVSSLCFYLKNCVVIWYIDDKSTCLEWLMIRIIMLFICKNFYHQLLVGGLNPSEKY